MCGIAGLVCVRDGCEERDHVALVSRMCDVQVHRGPDDRGTSSLGRVCLGSNRLSIIDLSPAGHMPMADHRGRYWITYNGETYNFRSLRDTLAAHGHTFASHTDTEVVMCAFRQWGTASFERLVGMFAFAVVDLDRRTVTLVRDRFGKKPLYYTHQDGHVLFASEVKTLLRVSGSARPNAQRLIEWSLYRNADFGSADTLVEGVFALQPGHFLTITDGQAGTQQCYYTPDAQVDRGTFDRFRALPPRAAMDEIEARLVSSVRARLMSEV